jgi:DNA-binding NtrC family response regulator
MTATMREDRPPGATWVTTVDGKPARLALRKCRLTVIAGADQGLRREFEEPVIRVGAKTVSDLVVADPRVSGLHLEIRLEEQGYRLRDLGSTNGTFVQGMRVVDAYLTPGAEVQLGKTVLRFEALDDAVELPLAAEESFVGLHAQSAIMRALFARLARIAESESTVLVTGETGTGKELVAEAIHERSPRQGGPFVVFDCGAVPATLFESELFGHERGAFTGAIASHAGAAEQAEGGTLLLDEIGELPLELQPKLLRLLERKEVRRVGGSRAIATDARIVAATHRDLALEVSRGRFREDLYHRLAVLTVEVPPLRQRKDDIPLLCRLFLERIPGAERLVLDARTLAHLMEHDWPGNVRELRNRLERAVRLAEPPVAPAAEAPAPEPAPAAAPTGVDLSVPFKLARQRLVEEFEKRYVGALLAEHEGNVSAAARSAGIDRITLHRVLARLGYRRGWVR